MRPYKKPQLYHLGTLANFINGAGNGNAHDFYATVCEAGSPLIGESCHNNPNSPVCQYFEGQGYVVIVTKDPPCNK